MSTRSLLYGATVLTGSAFATQLLGFAYRVVLSRLMGAEAMGIYQLVLSVYSVMLSVCLTGLSTASLRLSAQYKALGRGDEIQYLIKRLFSIFALLALAVCAAVLAGDKFIANVILSDDRARAGIVLLVPVILLTGIENILKNHFVGIGRVLPEAICETGEMVVRAAAVTALLLTLKPKSAEGAVACVICGMAVSEVFSSCSLLLVFRRSARRQKTAKKRAANVGKSIASIALPVSLTSFCTNLLGSANNILIPAALVAGGLTRQSAMAAMGELFGMTIPMVALPGILIDGLLGALMPSLSDSVARGDMKAVRRKFSKALLAVNVCIIPVLTVMIPLFPAFAKLLYKTFNDSEHIFLLSIWMVVGAMRAVSAVTMTGIGKQGTGALNFIIGSVLQLVITWALTPRPGVGLTGAVVGMIASAAVSFVLNLVSIKRFTGLEVRFASWFVCPVVSAAGAYMVGTLVTQMFAPSVGSAVVRAAVTAAVYVVLIRAMGIRHTALFMVKRDFKEKVR